VKPKPSSEGAYWDNAYHYGDTWEGGMTVTFFPILQPVIVLFLTGLALLLHGLALFRTFRGSRKR
jgi:hypothetical protein